MRLNRVLLLAASLSIMIFAMVFTISCSGDDGKDGKPGAKGADCRATNAPDGSGVNIFCGDDPTPYTLKNGTNGAPGAPGKDGAATLPDGLCVLGALNPATGNYGIKCGSVDFVVGGTSSGGGGEITGELGGCNLETPASGVATDPDVVLVCGSTEIYLCSGVAYDPDYYACERRYTTTNTSQANVWYQTDYDYDNGNYSSVIPYNTLTGVLVRSLCNDQPFNSRKQFCDYSTQTPSVQPKCGPQKELYRTGPIWNEKCENNYVTRPCGTGAAAPRYIKSTHFCEDVTFNPHITQRCGTLVGGVNNGQYNTGKNLSAFTSTDGVYPGDGGFNLYATGSTYYFKNPVVIGNYYLGEYSTAQNNEFCENGQVVRHCGDQSYSERTHFCAAGDIVAPHCGDRVPYDPTKKFCSFAANSQYNIPFDYTDWGSANDNLTYSVYGRYLQVCNDPNYPYFDPNRSYCKQFLSTALEFCPGTNGITKYNANGWQWEYCTEPIKGSFSVLRCPPLQEPIDKSLAIAVTAGDGTVNVDERSRCGCIENSQLAGGGVNGCVCKTGFQYYEENATGLNKSGSLGAEIPRLNGGRCIPNGPIPNPTPVPPQPEALFHPSLRP